MKAPLGHRSPRLTLRPAGLKAGPLGVEVVAVSQAAPVEEFLAGLGDVAVEVAGHHPQAGPCVLGQQAVI